MTDNVILSLVSAEGTVRVDYLEGEHSANVAEKIDQAMVDNPLLPKLGRTSIKALMYGHKTSISGWHTEKDGINLATGQPAVAGTIEQTVLATDTVATAGDGSTGDAPKADDAANADAPEADATDAPKDNEPAKADADNKPADGRKTRGANKGKAAGEHDVLHTTTKRKGGKRVAKTTDAKPATTGSRREKVYKIGPKVSEMKSRGMIKQIVELVQKGVNTQAEILKALGPDVNKSTVQHEICMAGPAFRNYIAIDEDAMNKAAEADAAAAAKAETEKQAATA